MAMYGWGTTPKTEETLMTRPPPWARMCGRTAFVMRMTPRTLMFRMLWAWVTEFSSTAPAEPMPALLTRTSMRPNRSITSSTAAVAESSLATSRSRYVTPGGGVSSEVLRPVPITSKPAATKARAVSLPIPDEAPVTSATGRVVAITNSLDLYYVRMSYVRTTICWSTVDGKWSRPAIRKDAGGALLRWGVLALRNTDPVISSRSGMSG